MLILEILIALIIGCSAYILSRQKQTKVIVGARQVPLVTEGYYPIVGNGITFSKDIVGFIKRAKATHGNVFRVKIYRKDIIVICDQNLKDEFFKANENEMSLYDALNQLFFDSGFTDRKEDSLLIMKTMKKIIKINFDVFSTKIMEEATRMIDRLKAKQGQELDLTQEMIRFVAYTSAKCFTGLELTDEVFDALMKFTHLLNHISIMTYFLPKSVLRWWYCPQLRKYRAKIINFMDAEINKYRVDPNKNDSYLFRYAVDQIDSNGKKLSNTLIGEIIVCLLFVSSENTAFGLASVMLDIINNPKWWHTISNISQSYLSKSDIKSLLADETLNAVIHETARMNTHIFPIIRKPINKSIVIGDFFMGDTDCIALCPPMLMLYDEAKFPKSLEYNPDRYITDGASHKPKDIITWGAGHHLCPGKTFALYEIKIAMSLLTNNFELPTNVKISSVNYSSPSAFVERTVKLYLNPLIKSTTSTKVEEI